MRGKGKPFKPGNSASKGKGRPAVTPEVKLARTLNKAQVEIMLSKYMGMAEEDLRKKQKEKGLPIIDKAFITCLLMAAKGKLDHLNFVMDRTIGKLQPQINVQNNQINFTGLPREEIIKRGQEALKILEAEKE